MTVHSNESKTQQLGEENELYGIDIFSPENFAEVEPSTEVNLSF